MSSSLILGDLPDQDFAIQRQRDRQHKLESARSEFKKLIHLGIRDASNRDRLEELSAIVAPRNPEFVDGCLKAIRQRRELLCAIRNLTPEQRAEMKVACEKRSLANSLHRKVSTWLSDTHPSFFDEQPALFKTLSDFKDQAAATLKELAEAENPAEIDKSNYGNEVRAENILLGEFGWIFKN